MAAEVFTGTPHESSSPLSRLITSDGRFFVQHQRDGTPEPVRNYLSRAGTPLDEIDRLFDPEGRFHYIDAITDPYALSPEAADRTVSTFNAPVLRMNDRSLDAQHPFGFNAHGRRHIVPVKEVGQRLLRQANASPVELLNGLVALEFHDDGNFLSRDFHAELSPSILFLMLPRLKDDPVRAATIRDAILLHDPNTAYKRVKEWGRLTAEERILYIRRHFSKEALALFIADKTHIGRNRISPKATEPEAAEDKHVELNLLGETAHVGVSDDGKTFDWRLAFKPHSPESIEHASFTRQRSSQEGLSVRASSATHKKHRQAVPSPHFHTWQETFWTLGFDRNLFVVQAAFALFPEVENVVISFHDTPVPGNYRIGRVATETFQQEYLDASIANLITMHVPKEKRPAMREKLLLGNGHGMG